MPEFESLTGIKVKYEILPEIQARQKLTVEMTAGSGGLDAFLSSLHVEKRRFWKSGWYEPLNKYLEDKTLTAPDYDWNDFTADRQGGRHPARQDGERDPQLRGPRHPLLPEGHLPAEGPEAAQDAGGDGEPGPEAPQSQPTMYGFVARGLKNANASALAYIVFAMGGEYLTPDRKSALNIAGLGRRASTTIRGMLRRFAPPGVVNFNWSECSSAFMQGQVAMYFDGVNFATQFEDKEKSKVAGKVGYALLPAGPGRPAHLHVHQRDVDQRAEPEQGGGLALHPVGHQQAELRPRAGGGRRRRPSLHLGPARGQGQAADAGRLVHRVPGKPEDRAERPARDRGRHPVPGHHRAWPSRRPSRGASRRTLMAQAHKEFQEMLDKTEK